MTDFPLRERQIITVLVQSCQGTKIGEKLHLAPRTIDAYRSWLMTQVDVPDVTAQVQFAKRAGLIDADPGVSAARRQTTEVHHADDPRSPTGKLQERFYSSVMNGTRDTDTDRTLSAKRWAALLLVLVVPDAALSDRLVSICQSALPGVHCVICEDEVGAVSSVSLGGVDLVIVDARLAQLRSAAWLANLRRQIPRGRMLLLDGNSPGQLLALAVSLPVRLADRVTRLSIEGTS